jgi:hypothetical protein
VFFQVTASLALIVTLPGENPVRLMLTVTVAVGAVAAGAAKTSASAAVNPIKSLRMVETPSVRVRVPPLPCSDAQGT